MDAMMLMHVVWLKQKFVAIAFDCTALPRGIIVIYLLSVVLTTLCSPLNTKSYVGSTCMTANHVFLVYILTVLACTSQLFVLYNWIAIKLEPILLLFGCS